MIKVATSGNDIETQMLCGMLETNRIPYVKREKEAGGYLRITAGYSLYGCDFYVGEADEDAAKGIVEAMEIGQGFKKENEDSAVQVKQPWYRKKEMVARIVLAGVVASALFGYVLEAIVNM